MKTASLTYQTPRFIDTAPLAARYAVLTQAVLGFIAAGQFRRMVDASRAVARLVRVFTRLEAQNALLGRKLDMLGDKTWRERVLSDLGGLRKLGLWEAARKRALDKAQRPNKPIAEKNPAWLETPERVAESERLKARVRECGRATAHPRIFRDRYKMDFDGQFRLAPLPRAKRTSGQMTIYTQNTIVDYEWNNVPFAETEGLGPASVWPVEFYAAAKAEDEAEDETGDEAGTLHPLPVIPHEAQGDEDAGPHNEGIPLMLGPGSAGFAFVRDDKGKIPLSAAISAKENRRIFGPLS